MKILIVNTSDTKGGAARAAYRLHRAFLFQGVDSQMLVQNKISDDFTVISECNKIKKYFNKFRPVIDSIPTRFYKTKTLFSPSWFRFNCVADTINKINPDIVHLHWICEGMMSVEDIARIKAPIVWSLHDNWAFTGGCHIMWDCEKYKNECGGCPIIGSKKENDLSKKVFRRKQKVFAKKKDITIVGLSRWLCDASKSSMLLKDKKHINLPNPIDTNIFKPFDKETSRELWSLPKDKKIVLFGAMGGTDDINKGFKELSEALQKLKCKDVEFVIFGSGEPENAPDFGFRTHYIGHLYDDVSLVTLYNAVDVMLVPSLQEAFGQTASESMACGTPVVAFSHTGLLDIIDHKTNGYLAKPFDTLDLACGIEWILSSKHYDELCVSARQKVLKKFDSVVVAKKYVEFYKEILSLPGGS